MRFGLFCMMPWRDAVKPQKQVFADVLDQVRLAESLGFETAWFAEHHFSNYCLCPSPLVMAAYCAARTERISLRTQFALIESQLHISRGELDQARAQLDGLREEFRRSGMQIAELERRLLRLQIDRADAAALEKDARATGAGLIASRARPD